jgi:biopolymer transport protein ExbD
MQRRSRRGRGYRQTVEDDLEIMPLMNLFVAMIPMLLISAVFLNVTVIDMKAPPDAVDAGDGSKQENLALAVTIKDQYFVVEGRKIQKRVIVRSDEDAEDQLAGTLSDITARFPSNESIMVISQPQTSYSDIIAVMDISRESGLPSISLLGAE